MSSFAMEGEELTESALTDQVARFGNLHTDQDRLRSLKALARNFTVTCEQAKRILGE